MSSLHTLVYTPQKTLFYPTVLHFLKKVYIDNPKGFCLDISYVYIMCFDQINPHYLLFLYYYAPLSSLILKIFSLGLGEIYIQVSKYLKMMVAVIEYPRCRRCIEKVPLWVWGLIKASWRK
jgi:hypothetical protein